MTKGERLREARKKKGYTMERMSELLGISETYLQGVETGKRGIAGEAFVRYVRKINGMAQAPPKRNPDRFWDRAKRYNMQHSIDEIADDCLLAVYRAVTENRLIKRAVKNYYARKDGEG